MEFFFKLLMMRIRCFCCIRLVISETNCTPPAIDDFPADIFTRQQRQAGAVVYHIAVSLYLFLALAVVCDKYFVPAVEKICSGNETFL